MKTADAALLIRQAFKDLFGREPNRGELEFALAQSHLETSWGQGWSGDCKNSNNWGALQTYPSYSGPVCQATDSNADGKYDHGFQVWPTPLEGAKGYLKEAYKRRPGVLEAAGRGDVAAGVAELYRTGYFTGNACLARDSNGHCVSIDHETNKARYRNGMLARINGEKGFPSIARDLDAAGYPSGGSRGSGDKGSGWNGGVILLGGAVVLGGIAALAVSRRR